MNWPNLKALCPNYFPDDLLETWPSLLCSDWSQVSPIMSCAVRILHMNQYRRNAFTSSSQYSLETDTVKVAAIGWVDTGYHTNTKITDTSDTVSDMIDTNKYLCKYFVFVQLFINMDIIWCPQMYGIIRLLVNDQMLKMVIFIHDSWLIPQRVE